MSDILKQQSAQTAFERVKHHDIIGVGTGSTVNFFIDELAKIKGQLEGCIASSTATQEKLRALHIPVLDLNSVGEYDVYVDGADEVTPHGAMIKGGGGALTREKICAANAKEFICIVDPSKHVDVLGQFPLPVEVIPMARSYVARQLLKLGGDPVYREGVITDNGNVILDVFNLDITDPQQLESTINNIVGVVCHGIFSQRGANTIITGSQIITLT